jgi:hypothetical protein
MRVVISTQEPTVVPDKFLGLCALILAHRFASPQWIKHLAQHVAVAQEGWAKKVVALKTGQALLFAPAGLGLHSGDDLEDLLSGTDVGQRAAPLGQGYLIVQSRLRITRDGGHSLLAVADSAAHTRVRRAPALEPAVAEAIVPAFSALWSPVSPTASSLSTTAPFSKKGNSSPKVPQVPAKFMPLVRFLAKQHREGRQWVLWSIIGQANTSKSIIPVYPMRTFLDEAAQQGVVELSGWAGSDSVRLAGAYAAHFV